MTISVQSVGTMAHVSNGFLSVPAPAADSYAAGDLLVVLGAFRTTLRGWTVPAGWTELFTWDPSHRLIAKIATTSSEAAVGISPAAGSSSGATFQAQMIALRTTATWPNPLTSLISATALAGPVAAQSIATPALAAAASARLAIFVGHKYDDWTSAAVVPGTTAIGIGSSTFGDDAGLIWSTKTLAVNEAVAASSFAVTGGLSTVDTYSAVVALSDGAATPQPPAAVIPVANFTATPLTGYPPTTVEFTDTSTNSPTSWLWDFGNGQSSTAKNPSQVYSVAGTYTVTLTATNSAGSDSEVKTGYVVISPIPVDLPSPGEVLNIGLNPGQNHFSVQVAPNGAGSIATHTVQEIAAGYEEEPYFYTTPDGKVNFQAQMDGPTTSGSSYTRAELRELDEAGVNIKFDPFDGGVHWIRSKFTIKHQPPVKPEIVFMQLHDGDADRIAIRTQNIGAINMVVCRVNGSAQTPRLANPAQLDVEYEAMIRLHSGNGTQVTCEVYFNDMVTPIIVTTALAPSTHAAGWYFKAGLYNQSNETIDSATEYGAVRHRGLAHWHTGWAEPASGPSIPTVDTARAADFFAVM